MNPPKVEYKPSFFLRNGHINTIYTAGFRKPPLPHFTRKRIKTHDDDFIDIDLIQNKSKKLAILCHGLEGSSASKYIHGTSHILSKNGFDICAMNYRFCSGEVNLTPQMYHSGWTTDLHTTIHLLEAEYDEIYLAGFSLGGNLVLKYVGDGIFDVTPKLKAVSSISVPLDLHSSSLEMLKFQNVLYTRRFLKSLFEKIRIKHQQFPDIFDLQYIPKVKNVFDFDEYYTGPLNGFSGAVDYYTQCSSRPFLDKIVIPTLIVNAQDDPFLSKECFPKENEIGNSLKQTLFPKYGGHVGFYLKGLNCWEELMIFEFFKSIGS